MDRITTLLGDRRPIPKKTLRSERGELYDTILSRLNPARALKKLKPLTHGRLGYLLAGIPTKDLYSLISKCDDAERRGFPWGAIFWKEIRPQQQNV
jgi:hypothetical protein